jgi:hypothetical protein
MRIHRDWLRIVAVSVALGLAPAPVEAAWRAVQPGGVEASQRRETLWGLPRDDPAIAMGAIVCGGAVLVFFAWIAARTGDKS